MTPPPRVPRPGHRPGPPRGRSGRSEQPVWPAAGGPRPVKRSGPAVFPGRESSPPAADPARITDTYSETAGMYERFTDRARKVMQLANQEAQRFNHEYIGTEHILLGLVKEGSGVAANVLKNLDVDLRKIRLEVEKIVQTGPGGDQVVLGKLPHTPRAKKVIEYSVEEARNLNHNYVGTEHLLLGLLREQEGVAAQVLMNLGLKLEDVREEVLNLLGHNMPNESETGGSGGGERTASKGKSKTPALDSFGRDLTELARQGKLD